MSDSDEICSGCALERMCHANGKKAAGGEEPCSGKLRQKASWLLFWIPLIIIAAGLFLMVDLGGMNDMLSFGIVVAMLAVYYLTLKFTIGKNINK